MRRKELPKHKKWLRNLVLEQASLGCGRLPVRACLASFRGEQFPSLARFGITALAAATEQAKEFGKGGPGTLFWERGGGGFSCWAQDQTRWTRRPLTIRLPVSSRPFAGGVSQGYRQCANGSRHAMTLYSIFLMRHTHIHTYISAIYHRRIPRKK